MWSSTSLSHPSSEDRNRDKKRCVTGGAQGRPWRMSPRVGLGKSGEASQRS